MNDESPNELLGQKVKEKRPEIEEEQIRLTRIIGAIDGLLQNRDWQTFQELHFDREEKRVNRLLLLEARKDINEKEIYRLQGEWKWARRYSDLVTFARFLKNQLDKIKQDE